jgi:hypothetical protein
MARLSKSAITERVFCGKKFFCLADQSAPDTDVAAIEKRVCNRIIADHCSFDCGVDAFAGVGISGFLWARCSRNLFLVERRDTALALIQKNLRHMRHPSSKVQVVRGSAREFLWAAVKSQLSFDLVDLDPFGNCLDLLPIVSQLVNAGVICITTGEIYQIYRGLSRREGRTSPKRYRGKRARLWVTEELLPEIVGQLPRSEIIHFYAYPTSVRVIVRVGGYPIDRRWFQERPKFLSWLG